MNAQTEVIESRGNASVEPSRRVPSTDSALRPPVDIYEAGESIVLQADMRHTVTSVAAGGCHGVSEAATPAVDPCVAVEKGGRCDWLCRL